MQFEDAIECEDLTLPEVLGELRAHHLEGLIVHADGDGFYRGEDVLSYLGY